MSVQSPEWLVWMAVTVAGFWLLPQRFRDPFLAGVCLSFLILVSPVSAVVLSFFTVLTYFASNRFAVTGWRVTTVGAVIVVVLVYYKLKLAFSLDDVVTGVIIPLGLSYYAFRCLHYLIEKYKGTLPRHSFQEFANYLLFLPTLLAGPIHRFQEFHRDLRRHRWDERNAVEGIERIIYGYVKITFLANTIVADFLGGYISELGAEPRFWVSYLTMFKIGLTGYFLFSGYSDIAIGFARLLGFRVMENFNWPLIRRNISEFWKSWHISLSSWCREYIYMVVISTTRQPVLAALTSMLVLGLWHEISIRYVVWGLYHGIGIAIWQLWQDRKKNLPRVEGPVMRVACDGLSICLTFHFVMLGFVIPVQDSLADTFTIYRNILMFWL